MLSQGFEPRLFEPKSNVLPLHQKSKLKQTLKDVLFLSLSFEMGSVCLSCGSSWTRTNELKRENIYSVPSLPLDNTPKLGKEKMVAWTTPFTIGFTVMISTPKIYPTHHQVSTLSSFPNQPIFARVRDHDSLIQVLETCVLPITPYPHFYYSFSSIGLNVSKWVVSSKVLNPSSPS